MTVSRDELMRWSESLGLDLVGVSPIDRYTGLAPECNPTSIFPEARSVIVFGRSIPRSYYRGVEEGTVWMRVNRWLPPKIGYYLCRIFEDRGFLAVPASLIARERWPEGTAADDASPAPNVSPDVYYAAQLSGVGEIGLHGLLISPQFGVRQALGMLFTDAEIEPNEPFESGTICRRGDCRACLDACPVQAIADTGETIPVGEDRIRIATYRNETCAFCVNGAFPDTSYAHARPNRMTAACVRACIARLEDDGVVDTRYRSPFRRRATWGFGTFSA